MTSFAFDLYRVLRFATRLPLPQTQRENNDPIVSADRFAPGFAASGLIVGLLGGSLGVAATLLGASPHLAAILAVCALIAVTGALHEDGLADCADGIGGGRTAERKLAIMRDPHVGTYGVLALVLSVGGRVICLASLFAVSPWLAFVAILTLQAASRAFAMVTAWRLDHARPDGAASRLGRPSRRAALLALGLGVAPSLVFWPFMFSAVTSLLLITGILVALALVTWLIMRAADHHIGGQTGDILGANQQACDLAGLVLLSISVGSAF